MFSILGKIEDIEKIENFEIIEELKTDWKKLKILKKQNKKQFIGHVWRNNPPPHGI